MSTIPYVIEQTAGEKEATISFQDYWQTGLFFCEEVSDVSASLVIAQV